MEYEHRSDDELMAAERRAYRARFIGVAGFAAYGFIAAVALAYAIHAGIIPRSWIAANPPLIIVAAVLLIAVPAIVIFARRISKAIPPRRVQKKLIEDYHRRGRIAAWLAIVVVPLEAAIVIAMEIYHGGIYASWSDLWFPVSFLFIVAIGLRIVLRGPASEDEVTRSNRLQAARAGFIAATGGFAAVYVLSALHPDWARLAAPGVIAAAIVVALATFLIADWRAGREE